MTSEEELRKFLASAAPEKPIAHESFGQKAGDIAMGLGESITAATPFARQIGSGISAAIDAPIGSDKFKQAYEANEAANKGELTKFRGEHPILSAGTTLAASVPMLMALPGGAIKVGAEAGGLNAAAESHGDLKDRAIQTAEGAAGGAVLGGLAKGAEVLGARNVLPLVGAGAGMWLGGGSGGGMAGRAAGGVVGGLAGLSAYRVGTGAGGLLAQAAEKLPLSTLANLAKRFGPKAASEGAVEAPIQAGLRDAAEGSPVVGDMAVQPEGLQGVATNPDNAMTGRLGSSGAVGPASSTAAAPSAASVSLQPKPGLKLMRRVDPGLKPFARAMEQDRLTAADIGKTANERGAVLADVGPPGGAVQDLLESIVQNYHGQDIKAMQDEIIPRGVLGESAAQKSARKAMGFTFKTEPPAVAAEKAALREKVQPAWDAMAPDLTVDSPALKQLLQDEPAARDAYNEGVSLLRRQAKRGMDRGADVPDFFKVGTDEQGNESLTFHGDAPVRAVDYMRQGLNSLIQKRAGSTNPISRGDAAILRKGIGDVMAEVKDKVPEYANALKVYGDAAQESQNLLAKRAQLSNRLIGGSPTARRVAGAKAFEGETEEGLPGTGGMMGVGSLLRGTVNKVLGESNRAANEENANAVARMAKMPLSARANGQELADQVALQELMDQVHTILTARALRQRVSGPAMHSVFDAMRGPSAEQQ